MIWLRGLFVGLGFGLVAAGLPVWAAGEAGRTLPARAWERVELPSRGGEAPRAIASAESGRLAVGDGAGVAWRIGDDGAPRRAVLPAVRALAFDLAGVLWVGTEAGLYRIDEAARPQRRSLRGAEGDPGITDLVVRGVALLAATGSGAFWSSDGRIFQPLETDGVATPVRRLAVRAGPPLSAARGDDPARRGRPAIGGTAEVWLLGDDGLWVLRGIVTAAGLRVFDRERVGLPRPVSESAPVAMDFGPIDEHLVLLYPDALAIRPLPRLESARAREAAVGARAAVSGRLRDVGRWRLVRPVLAPGARALAFTWDVEGFALATDHGVFRAAGPDGRFLRSGDPVGTEACPALVRLHEGERGPGSLALCRSGLYRSIAGSVARVAPDAPAGRVVGLELAARATPRPPVIDPDPPLSEIRARALARAGLDAARSAELWTGLRRRAYWPELELRVGASFDTDEARDRDQSFVSGETRSLFDHSRDRGRQVDASIALDWDLGGLVYPLESVDLSRELRQVLSLRDDVSDEINQLYFEREAIRATFASGAAIEPAEATRLALRASEIAAGLDAWTGGWLTQWRRDRSTRPPRDPPWPSGRDAPR